MLKILKGDLEAKEHTKLSQSKVRTIKHLQIDTHHMRHILVLKVFWKKYVFCNENHSANRCVKITGSHSWKLFLSSGHCFTWFGKSHITRRVSKFINVTNLMDVTTFRFCESTDRRPKMFLEISQKSQENTSVRVSFLIKLQAWGLQLFFKKRLWHWRFPVKFAI